MQKRHQTSYLFAPITGADFRSLNADFRSQMHVADVLKPAFQSQKKASELKCYLFQVNLLEVLCKCKDIFPIQ